MSKQFKNILIHLRFHFGLFLLPIFLYSLSTIDRLDVQLSLFLFIILHLIVYPSSNGYNSLQDQDTGSIGGIKSPPKCPKEMFWVTIGLDVLAIILAFLINLNVSFLIFLYISVSRLYSYRKIRLKKYPIVSFLIVSFFQGSLVLLMVYYTHFQTLAFDFKIAIYMLTSFLMIGATYPLTQIYQHKEDREDGVFTISMLLGKKGTFYFSALFFLLFTVLMIVQLNEYSNSFFLIAIFFIAFSFPFIFFNYWMFKVLKNEINANFENTMKMNLIASSSFIIYFLLKTYLQIV